ncbi:hypothetical protein Q8A73_018609 [Channa argus]|nr:hypothetical protein Q8A73_018609 [Channa argus]
MLLLLLISFIRTAPTVNPKSNLKPGKTVSLQCVFLTSMEQRHCYTQQQQYVSLMWVDEVGTVIEEDSQHLIKQQSSCDITLTVSLHTTEKKMFRCQATVAERVETSLNITVGDSGGSQYMIGGAVGVVGCVVLTTFVVILIMNKRRTNSQEPDGQCSVQSNTNNVINTDDVIYADVILPASADRVCVHECESSEYACVRY